MPKTSNSASHKMPTLLFISIRHHANFARSSTQSTNELSKINK